MKEHFELVSAYEPAGDQPAAIKEIVEKYLPGSIIRPYLVPPGRERHLPCPMS